MDSKMKKTLISVGSGILVLIGGIFGVDMIGGNDSGSSSQSSVSTTQSAPQGKKKTTTAKTESVKTTSTKAAKTTAKPTEAQTTESSVDRSYVEYHFRTDKQLKEHYSKHGGEFGAEFGYTNEKEYEHGASDVINDSSALHKTEAEDGDGVYYIEATNEFVILSTDGYIRTYFRPSKGIDYYNRQ